MHPLLVEAHLWYAWGIQRYIWQHEHGIFILEAEAAINRRRGQDGDLYDARQLDRKSAKIRKSLANIIGFVGPDYPITTVKIDGRQGRCKRWHGWRTGPMRASQGMAVNAWHADGYAMEESHWARVLRQERDDYLEGIAASVALSTPPVLGQSCFVAASHV